MTAAIRTTVCAALLLAGAAPVVADEVQWRHEYHAAREEATRTGRILVIDLGTESCYWCQQLELRTFRDPSVVTLLNTRCIPLKIDAQRMPALVEALRIQSYPTLVYAGPDGRILGFQEGFVEAGPFRDQVTKALSLGGVPDWMARDYQDAVQAAAGEPARAVSLLKNVVEDGRDRPVQTKARQLLAELEQRAAAQLAHGRQLLDKGQSAEGATALQEVARVYAGTAAARDATQLLQSQAARVETTDQRARRARDLLAAAREDYRTQQFLCCLDRCETLATQFADLPEGNDASALAAEIKTNPEWARAACEQMNDRLGILYLAQADNHLKKGQTQQAVYFLELVTKTLPGTRHAETASARLSQLQGQPGVGRTVEFKK